MKLNNIRANLIDILAKKIPLSTTWGTVCYSVAGQGLRSVDRSTKMVRARFLINESPLHVMELVEAAHRKVSIAERKQFICMQCLTLWREVLNSFRSYWFTTQFSTYRSIASGIATLWNPFPSCWLTPGSLLAKTVEECLWEKHKWPVQGLAFTAGMNSLEQCLCCRRNISQSTPKIICFYSKNSYGIIVSRIVFKLVESRNTGPEKVQAPDQEEGCSTQERNQIYK